jgi:hypothetical protein
MPSRHKVVGFTSRAYIPTYLPTYVNKQTSKEINEVEAGIHPSDLQYFQN